MLKSIFFIAVIVASGKTTGQVPPKQNDVKFIEKNQTSIQDTKTGKVSLKNTTLPKNFTTKDSLKASLSVQKMANEFEVDSSLKRTKDSLTRIKAAKLAALDTEQLLDRPKKSSRSAPVDPSLVQNIGVQFNSNTYGTSECPADNSVAVSNAGQVFSVVNFNICIYERDGKFDSSFTLKEFLNDTTQAFCDPKIIYDQTADRFIFFCQSLYSPSHIYMGFSSNNSALDRWNIYELPGDPTGNNFYFDYPKLAVTQSELVVTGNLYDGNDPKSAVILQVDKEAGYKAEELNYRSWTKFNSKPFTLVPLKYGQDKGIANDIYFVSSMNNGGSIIQIYHLTEKQSLDPMLEEFTFKTLPYLPPANAFQKGTDVKNVLVTLDSRIMDGFYLNGIGHFVFHVNENNYTGFRYYRIDLKSMSGYFVSMVDRNGEDYCYPSVASFGNTDSDQSSLVSFLASGVNSYPRIKAMVANDKFVVSQPFLIKEGEGPVTQCWDKGFGGHRWGDYSGSARKYNEKTPTVWIAGSYGTAAQNWGSYIAELYKGKPRQSPANATETEQGNYYTITFDSEKNEELVINLYNSLGTVVKELYKGTSYVGRNVFSFDGSVLPKGKYTVKVIIPAKVLNEANVELE